MLHTSFGGAGAALQNRQQQHQPVYPQTQTAWSGPPSAWASGGGAPTTLGAWASPAPTVGLPQVSPGLPTTMLGMGGRVPVSHAFPTAPDSDLGDASGSSVSLAQATAAAVELILTPPSGLPRLGDCADLSPPKHAEALLKALRVFECVPMPWGEGFEVAPPSCKDMADALGLAEVFVEEEAELEGGGPTSTWPPLEEECLERGQHEEENAKAIVAAAVADAAPRIGALAARLEASIREQEELRHRYDWSFERRLIPPSGLMLDALHRKEEQLAEAQVEGGSEKDHTEEDRPARSLLTFGIHAMGAPSRQG